MSGYRARVARLTILRTVGALVICLLGTAHAGVGDEHDVVALLPLDAEARLEVYGQPVASEIAKTLREGKIDVVVAAKKGSMPANATLIVLGSLSSTKTPGAVVLQLRLRDPSDGAEMGEKLEETAPSLTALPTAATKLAQRLLPVVKTQLEEVKKKKNKKADPPNTTKVVVVSSEPVMLVGVAVPGGATPVTEPLRASLVAQVGDWVRASKRQPSSVDASVLGVQLATQTVSTAKAERGVAFEILDYTIDEQETTNLTRFPLARARVRVRIADAEKIVFDRVISTDTIIGDRGMRGDALAARVAREVISILRPHMRRVEPKWR